MIDEHSEHIKINGYRGRWSVIDVGGYKGTTVYLLEHETYGDMTEGLIVDSDLNIICDDVWNGFDDLNYLD